jgi:hypothetical protein
MARGGIRPQGFQTDGIETLAARCCHRPIDGGVEQAAGRSGQTKDVPHDVSLE